MFVKGYKPTEEHIKNLKLSRVGRKPCLGKHWKVKDTSNIKERCGVYERTEEIRKNISIAGIIAHKKKKYGFPSGKDHPIWKGGNSPGIRNKYAPRPCPDKCEICNRLSNGCKRGLYYDHDHTTGKFRGWICPRCNYVLGMVHDDCTVLDKLKEYLIKNK